MSERRLGYYAVIPADVRYDDQIPSNAKLLYGEIAALISAEGYGVKKESKTGKNRFGQTVCYTEYTLQEE